MPSPSTSTKRDNVYVYDPGIGRGAPLPWSRCVVVVVDVVGDGDVNGSSSLQKRGYRVRAGRSPKAARPTDGSAAARRRV
jgi:hypothetical protein